MVMLAAASIVFSLPYLYSLKIFRQLFVAGSSALKNP